MYISTEIASFAKWGSNEQILRLLKEAGFDAYDYSMFYNSHAYKEILLQEDYIELAKEFRKKADEIGIVCNQAHAPFPTATDDSCQRLGMTTAEYNAHAHKMITRAIEVAAILGAKIIIVHPYNDYSVKENEMLFRSFEKTARRSGIKIALENMWNCEGEWGTPSFIATPAACSHHDDFKAHLDVLPKDVFVACLDVGHAEMRGLDTTCVQMIETLGADLQALHIHDNDKVLDCHGLPYTMSIDFKAVLDALKRIGYQGDVTLEADAFIGKYPLELYPAAAKLMAATAEYMRKYLLQ